MASWKLVVEDYGKIKSAEIEMAHTICLEETEDTGKSLLTVQLASDDNLRIKNVDKKNTQLHLEPDKKGVLQGQINL